LGESATNWLVQEKIRQAENVDEDESRGVVAARFGGEQG